MIDALVCEEIQNSQEVLKEFDVKIIFEVVERVLVFKLMRCLSKLNQLVDCRTV